MRTARLISLFAAVLLVAGGTIARAESGEDDPVRLYTNEDLAKYAPPPGSHPRPSEPEPSWESIVQFLDRQYARLDAERRLDLERARVESEVDLRRGDRDRSGALVLAPWSRPCGLPRARPYRSRWPGRGPAEPPSAGPSSRHRPPLREFMSRRETIHGQPRLTPRSTRPTNAPSPGRARGHGRR
jgi:hypothetical protein